MIDAKILYRAKSNAQSNNMNLDFKNKYPNYSINKKIQKDDIYCKNSLSKSIYPPPIQGYLHAQHKINLNNDTKNKQNYNNKYNNMNLNHLNKCLDKYSKKVNFNNRYNSNNYQINNFCYQNLHLNNNYQNNYILNNNNYKNMNCLENKNNKSYKIDNIKTTIDNYKLNKKNNNEIYKKELYKNPRLNNNKVVKFNFSISSEINMKEKKFKKIITSKLKFKQIIKKYILKNIMNKWKDYAIKKKYDNKFTKMLIIRILKISNDKKKRIIYKKLIYWKNKINNHYYDLEIKKKHYIYFINLLIKKIKKKYLIYFFIRFLLKIFENKENKEKKSFNLLKNKLSKNMVKMYNNTINKNYNILKILKSIIITNNKKLEYNCLHKIKNICKKESMIIKEKERQEILLLLKNNAVLFSFIIWKYKAKYFLSKKSKSNIINRIFNIKQEFNYISLEDLKNYDSEFRNELKTLIKLCTKIKAILIYDVINSVFKYNKINSIFNHFKANIKYENYKVNKNKRLINHKTKKKKYYENINENSSEESNINTSGNINNHNDDINNIVNKYKNEFILYYSLHNSNNDNCYAINKSWMEIWKKKVNYNLNIKKFDNKVQNPKEMYKIIEIKSQNSNIGKIKNKDILYDINSFLNDGNKNSIENKILKEKTYDIISKELWDSFKKYGYDEEVNSKIINYNKNLVSINLIFNFKNNKEKIYNSKVYIDDEKNLIKKIVTCLNIKNNEISKKINLFYNYDKKYTCKNFHCIYKSENEYIISFDYNKDENLFLVGLNNLGNTCFMNAVLQILYNIKKFSDFLYNEKFYTNCPITSALQQVFKNIRNSKSKSYSPSEFKNIISKYNSKILQNEPNDSRQLIQFILESVHNELNKSKKNYPFDEDSNKINWDDKFNYEKKSFNYENKSIIIDLFYGIQANETYCLKCKKTSYVFEHFNILSLPIFIKNNKNYIDLKDMIIDYNKKKFIKDKSQNYCLICNDYNEAVSKNDFYQLPEILIIYPGRKKQGIKYNITINFEEQLNIQLSNNLYNEIITYNLFGLVYHIGGVGYSGHNIAYCKIKDNWYCFNDSETSKINIRDISGNGVLLFFYQKES